MFEHILVPLDLGPHHEQTLRTARTLAVGSRARVTLLHVIQRVEHVPARELRGFYARLRRAARRRLEQIGRRLGRHVPAPRIVVLIGDPAPEIVDHAARHRVDLILLASHKVRPGSRARGLGTTSYKVGVFCQCPVLLVK